VTLKVDGGGPPAAVVQTTTAADGTFRLACPELPGAGPYRLRVHGSRECVLDDVLVGEVWLASGQSNMEWKVAASAHAPREIAEGRWPHVRMFTVERQAAGQPQAEVVGVWRPSSPETVDDFSAVGYFFAREIHKALGVPVGIVNASWGGTRVEAWTSPEALRSVMSVDIELEERARLGKDVDRIRSDYFVRLARWEAESLPIDPGNHAESEGWADSDFNDGAWRSFEVPASWQSRGMLFNGVVWFRKVVDLPAAWAGHDLRLSLGAIDDFDETYFNGSPVGFHRKGTPMAHQIRRRYVVPGARVRAGKNVVAVRVFDHFGEGGLLGPRSELFLETAARGGDRLPLTGPWRCQVEHRIDFVSGDVFGDCPPLPDALCVENAPGALFHGMIAPLVPFGLRGFLFYQGESNVDTHDTYRDRFVTLIRDWRTRWDDPRLPFYFVQLANFVASPAWAWLREAQTGALTEPQTGMAVTIDIGDPRDIHPRNKQDVGSRLARLALARTYGQPGVEWSGPVLERVDIDGRQMRLRFAHGEGLRARGGGPPRGFAVAGADGVYREADARIVDGGVVAASNAVPVPVCVRYAWSDNPEANLENSAGLPAAPFRTDHS
jgi:sialate O-acetylesterase